MNNTLKQVIKLLQSLMTPEEVIITKKFKDRGTSGVEVTAKINKTSKRVSLQQVNGQTVLDFNGRKVSTFAGFADCFKQVVDEANRAQ